MQPLVIIKRSEPENMEVLEAKEDCKQFLLPIISKMQEDITSYTRVQGRAYVKSRSKPWKMDSLLILMLGGMAQKSCKKRRKRETRGGEGALNVPDEEAKWETSICLQV
uniref:Uncharacterized protein n=1 Tax=Ursus maritimus TaxID=29073 RepID=A0A452SXW8_URSMA